MCISLIYQLKKLLHDVVHELELYGLTTDVVDDLMKDSEYSSQSSSHCASSENLCADTNGMDGPECAATPASRWISSLPRDERYTHPMSSRLVSRSKSLGSIKLTAHPSQNSPNTFLLSSNAPHVKSSVPSPRRHSLHSIHWSPPTLPDITAHLPPLSLPRSSGIQVGNENPTNQVSGNNPFPSARVSQPPSATNWMDRKAPELLPDDSSSYTASSHGHLSSTKADEPHWVESDTGRRVRAQYQLFNDSLSLHPQLVLFVESPNAMKPSESLTASPATMDLPPSESDSSTPKYTGRSSVFTSQHVGSEKKRVDTLDLGPAAKELPSLSSKELTDPHNVEERVGYHQRKLVIPLLADERFFQSLIKAIRNLLQLHVIQQNTLILHVNTLCDAIAEVASPTHTHQDMYAWREIFALWVEYDIFESSREKDRGELSVAATETRFHNYLEQLEKRGFLFPHRSEILKGSWVSSTLDSWALQAFAPNNPLQDPRSIGTLEHFLRLNVAIVSLKRFQRLNIETIRKILKKHQKKTALHASTSIGQITTLPAAHQLIRAASVDSPLPELDWDKASDGDILKSLTALAPVNERSPMQLSLPRILASIMTNALLPILPSIDDYSCLVCMSIAYHPIRLRCHHLFCIRCLVKLQKQGNNHCPLCRAEDAVKDADENNLDMAMAAYLREWFPREVEEKIQENTNDRLIQERHEKELRRKGLKSKLRLRRHRSGDADCVII